jgi:uncharacterized protein (DUF924 family)
MVALLSSSLINGIARSSTEMTPVVHASCSSTVSMSNDTSLLTDDDIQSIERVYSYWFGEHANTWSKTYPLKTKLWFKAQQHVDEDIRDKFESLLVDAATSNSDLYQRWQTTHRGKLVLIVLFDQFSRRMYRSTANMFEFDALAMRLAVPIVNDPAHVTVYSLPERIFLYHPLVHSESAVYTDEGARLLERLVSDVSQRHVRRRYATNAQSARVDAQIIARFGRYPDRNDVLGRASTPDEHEYLQRARNRFIRSVPTSNEPVGPSSRDTRQASSNETTPQLLRILVLHGLHQNGTTLKRKAKKVFAALKGTATFYFANAPMPYTPTGQVREQLLATFGDNNLPDTSYQRQWWNASADEKTYHHLDVSLRYIEQLFKSDGPFDGVLGFSVGDRRLSTDKRTNERTNDVTFCI